MSIASTLTELTDSDSEAAAMASPEVRFGAALPTQVCSNTGSSAAAEGRGIPKAITHNGKRMRWFADQKRQHLKKKVQMEGKRAAAAFERAIVVPLEFHDLKSSSKPKHERRLYPLEELEPLGVRVVSWNGR